MVEKFLAVVFEASGDFIGVGVTGNDPLTLRNNLPTYLRPGIDVATGLSGRVLPAGGHSLRLDTEIIVS